uniref:Upper collar protein n=1 Tax=Podoviridae sp. ctza028 TaxID=2825289 RepID=A0A8S5Q4N6_9CAUD|nr:MAG TPA: upper collar protein [Podoviridae sp. ctza028]
MARRRKTNFDESLAMNDYTYIQYAYRLMELSISMFEWKNLPEGIDERFLEMVLFTDGQAVFFRDDELGDYLALQCLINGKLNVYRIPINRRAFAVNGYQKQLTDKDSVIIFNNMLHTNSWLDVKMFAKRLYNLDRIIDVNANAQKTPILIKGNEQQRLTLMNLYKEYDGNAPVIFADKSLDMNALQVLSTQAPYVADKIYQLKTQIWNEALTYLGISNVSFQKRERMVSDEVTRSQGGTVASRYSRLNARRQACEQINKMFGLNIDCDFREDYQFSEEVMDFTKDNQSGKKGNIGDDTHE